MKTQGTSGLSQARFRPCRIRNPGVPSWVQMTTRQSMEPQDDHPSPDPDIFSIRPPWTARRSADLDGKCFKPRPTTESGDAGKGSTLEPDAFPHPLTHIEVADDKTIWQDFNRSMFLAERRYSLGKAKTKTPWCSRTPVGLRKAMAPPPIPMSWVPTQGFILPTL